ncbi:hypothetical protein BB560_000066 [Smittium megazygosporum]|uniref:Major facilitator superfamily (MFS) profile domain-containing protein n=1 Tax=Smittium megazygosporum TaxID=133381 RepID=A0A2T9ZLD9_9FUNG|nr:hypothetical protein BB560_000066 [Smittium megazygosporum]
MESRAVENSESGSSGQSPMIDSKYSWIICGSSFFLIFLSMGIENSFGIYQAHYMSNDFAQYPPAQISWIGTLIISGMLLASVVSNRIALLIGFRPAVWIGGTFAALGLLLASFAKSVLVLIFTQGLMFGIGSAFVYSLPITLTSMYFDKYRGSALGVMSAGAGIGGIVISNIINASIDNLGFRWALRITAIITLFFVYIASIPFKPVPGFSTNSKLIDFSAFRSPVFLCLLAAVSLTNLGYSIPIFFLPSLLTQVGASSSLSSASVTLLNAGLFVGCFFFGRLADLLGPFNVFTASTFLAGFFELLLSIIFKTPSTLAALAFFYGFFISGFISLGVVVVGKYFTEEQLSPYTGTYLTYSGLIIFCSNFLNTYLLDELGNGTDYSYLQTMSSAVIMASCIPNIAGILYLRRKFGFN